MFNDNNFMQVAIKITNLNELNENQRNKLPTTIKICKNCCELDNVVSFPCNFLNIIKK